MVNEFLQQMLNEIPEDVKIFSDFVEEIRMRIFHVLDKKEMSQKDLALKLDKRPSEVNKWLNGEHNLTLKTIAKLQAVLGEELISIPQVRSFSNTESAIHSETTFTVYRNEVDTSEQINDFKVLSSSHSMNLEVAS